MHLEPVARRSVSDAAFAQLEAEILTGRLVPGDAVPSERTLTEMLGVNRQAVREALKRLDQAGLVEINHGGATRVRDYRLHGGLDLLPSLLTRPDGSIDVVVARSIMEMRACIGPDAARLCAQRAVAPLPEQLTAIVEAMAAVPDDLDALSGLDWRFWELVVEGADNLAYRLAFNGMRDTVDPMRDLLPLIRGDELRDVAGHRDLAAAITSGHHDKAEAAARRVLQRGVAAMAAALASLDAHPPQAAVADDRPTTEDPR